MEPGRSLMRRARLRAGRARESRARGHRRDHRPVGRFRRGADLRSVEAGQPESRAMKGGDWAERGNRKLEEGDFDGAIECYETAIAADPAHAMAHYRAALVLQHLGRHAEADEHYGSAVEGEPELADAWVDWGNLAYGLGDPAAAISRLETALEAVPDHRRALHNLATILLADGDFDSARDLFERAIAAGNAESRLGLANAQSAAGDL